MKHFKRPLKITLIAFVVALVIGIVGSTMIYKSDGSRRTKMERSEMLGGGLGVATVMVIAPVWFFAAAKFGKERRENRP